jgi:hypothetical protein
MYYIFVRVIAHESYVDMDRLRRARERRREQLALIDRVRKQPVADLAPGRGVWWGGGGGGALEPPTAGML